MALIQRWRHLPRPYRIFATFFGAIDGIILAAVAASQRSWIHLAGAVVLVAIFLMSSYPFFVQVPSSAFASRGPRSVGVARIVIGGAVLFVGGWALVGAVLETIQGISSEYFAESIVFVLSLMTVGALFLRSGTKKLRNSSGLISS